MMPETIVVAPPTVSTRDGRAIWTAAISHPSLPEAVWYSVPEQYADLLTNRLDPALIALTIPALHLEAQIQLDGVVTDELLHQHRELQSVYVASEDGTNCTRCFKCLRTVATLDVLGKAGLFRERFDLEVWQQKRARYFGQLLATRGHDPFAAEILELVAETGYQLPAEAQREALRIRAKDVARSAERRVKGAARYLVRR